MNNLFKKISFGFLAFSFISIYAADRLDPRDDVEKEMQRNYYSMQHAALFHKKLDKVGGIVLGGGTILVAGATILRGLDLDLSNKLTVTGKDTFLFTLAGIILYGYGIHLALSRLECLKETEDTE
ncbi:MAG TPA: hypothetical protein VJJ81_01570 [Candidatus Babeliales bacterium]|nr:hypothetical protein [Candidatus Babeliales bacterium]